MHSYRDYRPDRRFQPTIAISPDGTQVAYSDNLSGQYNLVVASILTGDNHRLTNYLDATVRDLCWTPDGAHIIFAADANGDEFHQVRRIPVARSDSATDAEARSDSATDAEARSGSATDAETPDGDALGAEASVDGDAESLTDAPAVQFQLGDVSPDGRWIAYGGNDRDPIDQDVLVQDLTTGEVRRVFADGGSGFPAGWAPDSTRLIVARNDTNTEITLFLVDIDGGPAERLLPAEGETAPYAVPGPWLPDGSGFLVRTDAGRDFVGLARFDVATRELTWLVTPDWDVEDVHLSKDGHVVVWSVNAGGISELHTATLDGRTLHGAGPDGTTAVASMPAGQISALSIDASGTIAAAVLTTGGRPTSVVITGIGAGDGGARRLSDSGSGITASTVEPELVSFATHDGRQIPAWLYRPAGDGPFPVVLSIHGGPEAQERPAYNYGGLYQSLVAGGVAVLAPNIRGSNGYGRAYQRLVLRDFGGGDLGDLEAAAMFLRSAAEFDADRIGVFGGSYGGFATLSCLSRLPQYFSCGVDICGPSNLVTLAKSVPPTWRARMAGWVGDPETEVDFLLSRSPTTYADQIVAPLFVIQGANDPRVNKAESDGIVAALRERGVEVRYDVYDDEGHGFTRSENEIRAMSDSVDFLLQHLKAPTPQGSNTSRLQHLKVPAPQGSST